MSILISFASLDGIHVNQHFGWSEKFYMYKIDEQEYTFVKELDASQKIDAEVDKLEYKIKCLEESDIVCVLQIGPKAATMVQSNGIYPMSSREESIESVLQKIQNMLNDNPPLWLRRISLK